jgi:hypothetical protein
MNQASIQPGHTAQIFQFPMAHMRLRNLRRLELEAQNYCAAVDSASWYHQASIEAETREISGIR